MMCTDGLSDLLSTKDMEEGIANADTLQEAAEQLVEHINEWDSFKPNAERSGTKQEAYESLQRRVTGQLANLKLPHVKDQLWSLKKRGIISQSLVDNWTTLRNAATHGKVFAGLPIQEDLDRIDKATTLLYVVIFNVIGYEGKHTDYSTGGWPTALFPPTLP